MIIGAVWIAVIDIGVRYVIRFNVLGYFLILAGLALLGGAGEMLKHPDYFYQANGYGVVAALVVLFWWPFVALRGAGKKKALNGGHGVRAKRTRRHFLFVLALRWCCW